MKGNLGALLQAADGRATPVAAHPADDRLAHSEPIRGDTGRVEARAVIAHEGLRDVGAYLDVGRHRGRPVPDRVEQGLPQRPHQRVRVLAQRPVAGDDQVDRDAVQLLDLGRGVGRGRGEAVRGGATSPVQPSAQLAFL